MSISGINTFVPQSDAPKAQKNDSMDRNDFLNLLVVQLQNQDPVNPMQSAEFSAQLAQFSSLEQLTNINDAMKSLIDQQTATVNGQAVGYIGKQVKAVGNTVQVEKGGGADCHFEVFGAAEKAVVYITDAGGNAVRALELKAEEVKKGLVHWDGMNAEGQPVDEGLYGFEVVAMDAQQQRVNHTSYMLADVTGVGWKNGSTILMAGKREIPLSSVIQVGLAEPTYLEQEDEPLPEGAGVHAGSDPEP